MFTVSVYGAIVKMLCLLSYPFINKILHFFIFTKNTCRYQPISRTQAYRIVKTAAGKTVQDEHISCHSLRKTFGYHAWKNGTPPALLMDVYNHSSYEITQHYLGIEQDERDEIYLKLEL